MARPERNSVDYFPFYCEDGKKMFYLEETYGNDGFASFVKILRELAKTDYHYLDLSKNTTMMFLSAKCKVSKETLDSIIKDLVDLEKFDSFLWNENRIIWCQDFVDSIQDAYIKRKNKCITYGGLILHLISLGVCKPIKEPLKGGIKPQTILKETKEDKTILKKNPEEYKQMIDLYKKRIGEDDNKIWRNSIYSEQKLKPGSLHTLVDLFCTHLGVEYNGNWNNSFEKFRIHCARWIRHQSNLGKFPEYKTIREKGSI